MNGGFEENTLISSELEMLGKGQPSETWRAGMRIFTDDDLQALDVSFAANSLRNFLVRADEGKTDSPARLTSSLGNETLAFTAGADESDFGFRAYAYRAGLQRDKEDQVVACWDREMHDLKAIAIGEALGAWRTGILGGIAFQTLAGRNVEVCGVIGTGRQAYTQVRAVAELAKPKKFLVFFQKPGAKNKICGYARRGHTHSDSGNPKCKRGGASLRCSYRCDECVRACFGIGMFGPLQACHNGRTENDIPT